MTNPQVKRGTVVPATPLDRYKQSLAAAAVVGDDDTGQLMADTVEAILNASNPDEVFDAFGKGLPSGKNMVDIPHKVTSIQVRKGEAQYESGGLGYFLVVEGVDLRGELIRYSIGAVYVVTALWKFDTHGMLPIDVVIRSKPTKSGALLFLARGIDPVVSV